MPETNLPFQGDSQQLPPNVETASHRLPDNRPRTDHILKLKRPMPMDSKQAVYLRKRILPRKADSHVFDFNTPRDELLSEIELVGVPHEVIPEISSLADHVSEAWMKFGHRYEPRKVAEPDPKLVFKAQILMCMQCFRYDKSRNKHGPCVPVSSLSRPDEVGDEEYIDKYVHGLKTQETKWMEDGKDAHNKLEVMRDPMENVFELIRELAKMDGKWKTSAISICDPLIGARARSYDFAYHKLGPAPSGHGLQLDHIIGEDKPHFVKQYPRQLNIEAEIMTNPNVLFHNDPQNIGGGGKREDFAKIPGIPFMEALRHTLNADETVPIHVNIFTLFNFYENRLDAFRPKDHSTWIPEGGLKPNDSPEPRLWSRDFRRLDEQAGAARYAYYGLMRRRDAYDRGVADLRRQQTEFGSKRLKRMRSEANKGRQGRHVAELDPEQGIDIIGRQGKKHSTDPPKHRPLDSFDSGGDHASPPA